ncbi:MAG: lipopolysaccharide transport periplasmic protein LptA [Psychrobium sp.]
MKLLRLSALLLVGVLTQTTGYALTEDLKKQAHISADSQNIDLGKSVAIYKGNVKITQGSIEISADYLEIFNHGKRGEEVMVFSGKPAQFSQTMDDGASIAAKAQNIRFERANNLIKMSSDVAVRWGENTLSGDAISYDIVKRILDADGNPKNDEQVKNILQPKEDKKVDE